MTVPELIESVLDAIRAQFYGDRLRDFKRDEIDLTRAVTRYGYECNQRGWEIDTGFILREIMRVLVNIKTRENFRHLPVYLHSALGMAVGQHAEEIREAARLRKLTKATSAVKLVRELNRVEAIREPSEVEILAAMYRNSVRRRHHARANVNYLRRKDEKRQGELSLSL